MPPVAASAYWGLQSAAAFVAARLGTTLRHILQQHSMWHMAQARPRLQLWCMESALQSLEIVVGHSSSPCGARSRRAWCKLR